MRRMILRVIRSLPGADSDDGWLLPAIDLGARRRTARTAIHTGLVQSTRFDRRDPVLFLDSGSRGPLAINDDGRDSGKGPLDGPTEDRILAIPAQG
jgi:hypothetical protein